MASGLLLIPEVKADVDLVLTRERDRGELRRLLEVDKRSSTMRQAKLRYEGMIVSVELVPKRLEVVQSVAGDSPDSELVLTILRRIARYWRHKDDLIPDSRGLVGRLDDALIVHSLLDKLESHHLLRFREGFGSESTAAAAQLREGLSLDADRAVSSVVGRLWGDDFSFQSATPLDPSVPVVQPVTGRSTAGWRPFRPDEKEADRTAPRLFQVWFGTNREPVDSTDPARGFRAKPDPAGEVRYGVCAVEVPRSHKFGSVGTAWYRRWARLQFADDRLKIRQRRPLGDHDAFVSDLRSCIDDTEGKQVLFYLHGYNVSFDEAAIRTAQMFADLKVDGAAAFFSWPSNAAPAMYVADAARVEDSEKSIADFLTSLASDLGDATVHVIAHSMGNRGLARAVHRITRSAAEESGVRFGQIILAAPDVSVPLFKELALVYPRISDRTTMYVSAGDRALGLSRWLQDGPRAGFTPPITVVDDIDTVEVTDIDVSVLGHGYYAAAEAVLYDIAELLNHNAPPARRTRLHPCTADGVSYWSIGR